MSSSRRFVAAGALTVLLVALAAGHPGGRLVVAGTIIYVDAAAGGNADGSSWANAYHDVQDGLAAAATGDQVWVAQGRYVPGAARGDSFVLGQGVALYGGFAGWETSTAQRDVARNLTTLSGNIGDVRDQTDNSYHVVSGGSVGSTSVLDGFSVDGGFANGAGADANGAGLTLSSGSPTLANLTFSSNTAASGGGGAFIGSGSPTLSNGSFVDNRAGSGGAIYNESGSPVFTNLIFNGNAAASGGGMYNFEGDPSFSGATFRGNVANEGGGFDNYSGTPVLSNVTFVANRAGAGGGAFNNIGDTRFLAVSFLGNSATGSGGGLATYGTPTLTNVTFSGNTAAYGGGLDVSFFGGPSITHVTFVHNRATVEGGAIAVDLGAATVRESILWANAPDQFYEDAGADVPVSTFGHNVIQGGCPPVATCTPADIINADPKLGVLGSNGGSTKTHALQPGSPAIDAGTAAICATMTTDQRGIKRPVDGNNDRVAKCDLGAFEFAPPAPSVRFTSASSLGAESVVSVTIPVQLSAAPLAPVTVKYKLSNGTAKSPSDYTAATGTLTFPAYTTTRNITFSVANDRFDEPNETVLLTLSAPAGATLGPATHVYTIKDDDPHVTCRGRLPTIIGTEGNDTLTGTKGPDVIIGLDGNDAIEGNGGDDVVCGGPGIDTVSGGNGNDMLVGASGNDTLRGDRGSDLLAGGGGKDKLAGGASGGDSCDGGSGSDVLLPNAGCESENSVP